MSGPEVDEVSTAEGLAALEAEWHSLAESCAAQPFAQPAVALPWWRHLGKGRPLVVTVRQGGRLVGLAPLHCRRRGGLDVVRFVGHGMGAVGELLIAPDAGVGVAEAIWQHLGRCGLRSRVLELTEFRHQGRGLDELRASSAWRGGFALRDRCPVIDLAGVAGADAFLAGPGRRKLRQNLARVDRFAAGAPRQLAVEVLTGANEVAAVVGELVEVHDRAEAMNPRQHFLAGPNRAFTEAALTASAASKRLGLVVVRLDGEAVGFHVCLRSGDTGWAWLARFAPPAADWAPGHLMLRAVLDWCVADGATRLDLQLGAEPYKLRWATGGYDTIGVLATPTGRAATGRAALGRAVVGGAELMHRLVSRYR